MSETEVVDQQRFAEAFAKSLELFYEAETLFLANPTPETAAVFIVAQRDYVIMRDSYTVRQQVADTLFHVENPEVADIIQQIAKPILSSEESGSL